MAVIEGVCRIVGGVDTHKDLHVAAIVDEQDRIIGTRSFATTRQGYRQMLAWMRSFGVLQRIGIESTGSYGAGLLRFMQQAKVTVLEVTTPDKQDRRRRGKNDDLDAQNAPCRLCRPADRDAAKPGRHDRSLRVLAGLPEDGGERQAYRPADDPQHDRLRPRWPARSTAQPHPPSCSSSVRYRLVATPTAASSPLIATWDSGFHESASNPSPAVTSSCMTRSQISTR